MPTYTDNVITAIADAGEQMEPFRCVKIDGDRKADYTASGERPDGFTILPAQDGAPVAVVPANKQGTVKLLAVGNVDAGGNVYPAADGKVSAAVAGNRIGKSLTTIVGGGLIEVLPIVGFEPDLATNINSVISFEEDWLDGLATEATTGKWVVAGDASTVSIKDERGGILNLLTGANDNDQKLISTIAEIFKPGAGKDMVLFAKIKPIEAATNDSGWFIGLSDDVATDFLADDTCLVKNTFDGFGFTKRAGSLAIEVVSSNGVTQTLESSGVSLATGVANLLKIEVTGDGATATIKFFIDDMQNPVKTHTKLFSGLDEMHGLMTIKTGHAGAEAFENDFIRVTQLR